MQNFITRPQHVFLARIAVLIMACLLIGCSGFRLIYNNGEFISYQWLNTYVDFDVDQKPWVKKRIDNWFAWHRNTQLKEYPQLLLLGQQQLQRKVSAADILVDYDNLKKHTLLMIDQILPDLADLALSLQPGQIAHIEKKFRSNNDSYRKDYLRGDIEDRQKFRYKKVMKHAEFWFGSFSHEQEQKIRNVSDARPLNNELWMKKRLQHQQELIAMLKKIQAERPSRNETIAMLKKYVGDFDAEHESNAELRRFFDDSRTSNASMMATIINLSTAEQKAHALKSLQKWSNDFTALAVSVAM